MSKFVEIRYNCNVLGIGRKIHIYDMDMQRHQLTTFDHDANDLN